MSVVIKGMEMPETCDDCPFHIYHSHYEYVCKATPLFYPMNLANSKGIRKDWCPLIALPDKHGRLIDADELMDGWMDLRNATKYGNKSEEQQHHSYSTMMMYEIADEIEDALTVLEAEGEQE